MEKGHSLERDRNPFHPQSNVMQIKIKCEGEMAPISRSIFLPNQINLSNINENRCTSLSKIMENINSVQEVV